MNDDEKEAFLNHIRESKEIVDGWPAWKRENSDSIRNNNHENPLYDRQPTIRHSSETETKS
ncbi:hypothetical protein [Morganella psychrotolerans]|uniref:Uncharacterized protein n=1 Tax=Morganella psychrotolerans TaxID=368603 RepID=A0A1B8HA65_9GAMM|nr:hypothetical protein [Morganella psychrotolerans]OBU05978.1 hypothetical protein AYY17_06515 [Morganella psychrotolerans]